MDPRNRAEDGEQTPTSWARSSDRPSKEVRPTSAASAKYECTYCGKGFSRPSSLKVSSKFLFISLIWADGYDNSSDSSQ